LATTNKNFKVKNGLDVNGPIGVGSSPSYGSIGQVLTSQGTDSVPTWTTVSSSGLTATDYVVTGKLSGDQTIASNTNDVLISFVDDFDPQGWWNATSKQFTPNIAGYYNIALHVWWTAAGVTTNQYNIQIRKNSNTSAIFQNQTVTGSGSSQGGSRLVYLNGTTDYVDFTAYNGDSSTRSLQWGGAGQGTWFSAALMTAGKGDQGDPGDPGAGVAAGGTAGQILSKVDGTDYNTTWIDGATIPTSTVKHLVKNDSGVTLAKGTVVYTKGANGSNILVDKALATTDQFSSQVLGFLETELAPNASGYCINNGLITGINTNGTTAGDPVWLSGTTAGAFVAGTANKPVAPYHLVYLGVITRVNTNNGEIFVHISNGWELDELHNVNIDGTPADNEVLAYDSTSTIWINQTASEAGLAALSGATFTGNVAGTNANLSGNVNAVTVNATALIGNTNASTITTGTIDNARTSANSANGASTIVARDATGNFSANNITASLTGTASYATVAGEVALSNVTGLSTALDAKANLSGATFTGDISVNGGDILTNQTTATLYNTTATTVNIGGAAEVNIGNITHAGNTTINNDLRVFGSITFNNGASQLSATTIQVDDTLISLSDNNIADESDIGFYAGYNVASVDKHTGLVRDASDKVWNLFSNVAQPTGTVNFANAIYDTLKLGNLTSVTSASNATIQLLPGYASNVSVIQIGNKSNVASTGGILFNTGTDGTNAYDSAIFAYNGNTADGYGTIGIQALGLIVNNASSNASMEVSGTVFANNISATNNVNATTVNATTVNATTFIGSGASLTSIPNSATTANSANGASTIVARDANGSFNGNVITATTFNIPFTRTNLITNPNLETNTAGWGSGYSNTDRVTENPQSGTYSVRATTNGEDPYVLMQYTQANAVVLGTSYRAGVWVRIESGTAPITVDFYFGNGANRTVYFTATTSWQFIQAPATTAAGNTTFQMSVSADSVTLFVDSLILELTSTYTGTFFDGNTPDANGIDYAWTGTANASTSGAIGSIGVSYLSGANNFTGDVKIKGAYVEPISPFLLMGG
jgi:hypothetical protein